MYGELAATLHLRHAARLHRTCLRGTTTTALMSHMHERIIGNNTICVNSLPAFASKSMSSMLLVSRSPPASVPAPPQQNEPIHCQTNAAGRIMVRNREGNRKVAAESVSGINKKRLDGGLFR